MNPPLLATNRLALRPAASQDLEELHGLWSEPEVRRFLFDDQDLSIEIAQPVLDFALECASSGQGLWLVYLKQQTELLGCVGLMPATTAAAYEPSLSGRSEALAAFSARHWHKGYALEALSAILTYAFDVLGHSAIVAVNDLPNLASERMLGRLGFERLSEVQGPKFRMHTYVLQCGGWTARRNARQSIAADRPKTGAG